MRLHKTKLTNEEFLSRVLQRKSGESVSISSLYRLYLKTYIGLPMNRRTFGAFVNRVMMEEAVDGRVIGYWIHRSYLHPCMQGKRDRKLGKLGKKSSAPNEEASRGGVS